MYKYIYIYKKKRKPKKKTTEEGKQKETEETIGERWSIMCLNHFLLVDHVFQPDFLKKTQKICAGFGGLVDQVFKPKIWKFEHVFKPSLA